MKLKRLWAVALPRLVRQLVARRGYVLLPITEIERMESDAANYYRAMKGGIFDETGIGYFNGLADHASKTATQLREKYLPNRQGSGTAERPQSTLKNLAP